MAFTQRLRRLRHGIYTPKELLLWAADEISDRILHKHTEFYVHEHVRRVLNPHDGVYNIGDIRLPILDSYSERVLAADMFNDTFHSYVYLGDRYDEAVYDECDKFLNEGLYGLVNDSVNVTVEPGDVVIDAGAWIGDFAAYASIRGAGAVYAFEPVSEAFAYLERTAGLNSNIIPVKKGISSSSTTGKIFLNSNDGSTMLEEISDPEAETGTIYTVSIDDFVRDRGLDRVDFIKADIEGYEREMLKGAQETLKRFAPKLALCTYHLPDDKEVMAELILKANPRYNIVQKRKKLFASVPE